MHIALIIALLLQLLLKIDSVNGLADLFEDYGYPPPNSLIRDYEFNLTHDFVNPDGKYRSGFLINGISPGPTIIGDEGDWIRVKVNNFLPVSASIHFHGILQKNTPFSDGVTGITQFPIISGDSYTYVFQFNGQYGASWYHAHYRGYSTDGIYGQIYIRPSEERKRPYNKITDDEDELKVIQQLEKTPIFLSGDDWFKLPMDDLMARMYNFGVDPMCIQSILVNGKGKITCHEKSVFDKVVDTKNRITASRNGIPYNKSSASLAYDTMGCFQSVKDNGFQDMVLDQYALENPGFSALCSDTKGEKHVVPTNGSEWLYINVLNPGGQYTKSFTIDDHEMYVISLDGVFIEPVKVQHLVLPVGSRFTVLVKTDESEHENTDDAFAIRFAAYESPQMVEGVAYLFYGYESDIPYGFFDNITHIDNGQKYSDLGGNLLGEDSKSIWPKDTHPYELEAQLPYGGPADHTFNLYLNRTGVVSFSMFKDGSMLPPNFEMDHPLLLKADDDSSRNFSYYSGALEDDIKLGDTVDIIINNFKRVSHPIHVHGHLFHLISFSNKENFPFNTVSEAIANNYTNLNVENPPYFDIAFTPPGGHSVIRLKADNPGVWIIHCHNLGHLMGGMGAVLFEAIDQIPKIPEFLRYQAHANYDMTKSFGISELVYSNHSGSF